MSGPVRWRPGEAIVLRELWAGRVWAAWPAIVVEDEPQQLLTYIPPGTAVRYATDDKGNERRLYADRWRLVERTTSRPVLSFARPGTEHAALAFWDQTWRFVGWYVNLECPLGRTASTYDFVDHCLDVLIPADRSSWTWKDEDELAEAIRLGVFTAEEAARFRDEGERAAAAILRREPPFDRDWASWRPDASWPAPALGAGWETPPNGE